MSGRSGDQRKVLRRGRTIGLLVAAAGLVSVTAYIALANGTPTANSAADEVCVPIGGPTEGAGRGVHREGDARMESTYYLPRGYYEVVRCDADGTLLKSQIVGPLKVPGGDVVDVPYQRTRQVGEGTYEITSITYGDPSSEQWREVWRDQGARAVAAAIPPTPKR